MVNHTTGRWLGIGEEGVVITVVGPIVQIATVQRFVNNFNTNQKENVASSNRKIADESMSALKP